VFVDAPTDFLPQRLKPIVINHGEIDRRAWECALLLKLRDELKAGNLPRQSSTIVGRPNETGRQAAAKARMLLVTGVFALRRRLDAGLTAQ
jgi:hypothetical protein